MPPLNKQLKEILFTFFNDYFFIDKTGFIKEWEEDNSGVDVFHFDSDEDIFCVYSQYIDDISLFSRVLRKMCDDEKMMRKYFDRGLQELNKQD